MDVTIDTYSYRARLAAALLVILPACLGVVVWLPVESDAWKAASGIGMSAGLTFLLSQLARDPGKSKQPALFAAWDGPPTTRLLRHRDTTINALTKARYHEKLQTLVSGIKVPSVRAEKANPAAADEAYNACVHFLREATRDKKKFPLVFEENVNYGFRRNLWGMRPTGVLAAGFGCVSAVGRIATDRSGSDDMSPMVVASAAISALLLSWWILRIRQNWVKIAADAYAERLLAACEVLASSVSSSKPSVE